MDVSQVLLIMAAACNVVAAGFNLYTARRTRRAFLTLRGTCGRALGFAMFVASAESGAPVEIRRLALRVLPEKMRVHISDPPSPRVH